MAGNGVPRPLEMCVDISNYARYACGPLCPCDRYSGLYGETEAWDQRADSPSWMPCVKPSGS